MQRTIKSIATPVRQKLLHIHFDGLVPYAEAGAFQQRIVDDFLNSKRSTLVRPPPPYIITAEFQPVYTCGRREIGKISAKQQDFLRADGRAEFVEAMRGGQTTFHGPGQLVAYPILDMRAHKLTPRTYVCLLEKSLIATCAKYNIKAMTTEHTGVWTNPDEKIAAIGVHMRRNITSHGIGLNVNTDLWWFDRITACGLEGKKTTGFAAEGVVGQDVAAVGRAFVGNVAERLEYVDGIESYALQDIDDKDP